MNICRESNLDKCARPEETTGNTQHATSNIQQRTAHVSASLDVRRWMLNVECFSVPKIFRPKQAFTLIEIMIVVAIMGMIVAMSVPSIYQITKKEGMRRAISDLKDVCSNARAQAIFSGKPVSVRFYPSERRFEVSSGDAPAPIDPLTGETKASPSPGPAPGTGLSGIIPEDITLEMLDVNMFERKDSERAVEVRFSEMGTSDEMTIILRDAENKYRRLTLEPTTGLLLVGDLTQDLTR
ncbi:MAG: prepilin-type N-terminal cleavage/methylation domain-containing protein [Verrucomicrobiales bacterium]|nr:MAG: prepilin-type N-terminal cleavage/methylation domain-containing protein [Verrucomicrobiales bacterium]